MLSNIKKKQLYIQSSKRHPRESALELVKVLYQQTKSQMDIPIDFCKPKMGANSEAASWTVYFIILEGLLTRLKDFVNKWWNYYKKHLKFMPGMLQIINQDHSIVYTV